MKRFILLFLFLPAFALGGAHLGDLARVEDVKDLDRTLRSVLKLLFVALGVFLLTLLRCLARAVLVRCLTSVLERLLLLAESSYLDFFL